VIRLDGAGGGTRRDGGGSGAGGLAGRDRASGPGGSGGAWPPQSDSGQGTETAEGRARNLVLDALSRMARTRHQLAAILLRKGVEPELAEGVLDHFEELGLIDDAAYAAAFVESRHEVRGLGSRALAYELRQRGVADETAESALETVDAEREFATACRLARNRARRMQGLPTEVRMRRLAGFLARKGYPGDTVSRAVRLAIDESDAEAAADLDLSAED